MYEEIIQKIKGLGLDDAMANDLFNALSEDVIQGMFEELADKSTDEEMLVYENRIKEAKSPEHFQTILNEIAVKAYGDEASSVIKMHFEGMIEELQKTIAETKELMQRAQNGDPDAISLLQKTSQSEDYQKLVSQQ